MKYLVPYKLGSASAKALAQGLGILRIRGDKILPRRSVLINWGRYDFVPRVRGQDYTLLNKPQAVAVARNKITALEKMRQSGINVPEFTTNPQVAAAWRNEDVILFGRKLVTSQEGRGIVILRADDEFSICPLYTKAIVKAHEYRVHVFKNNVIDFTKKRRRADTHSDGLIKNFASGWVFCRDGIVLPDAVRTQALAAVAALELDFAAVDVVYRERENIAWVLEANTAPGLEGTTLQRYIEAFRGPHET